MMSLLQAIAISLSLVFWIIVIPVATGGLVEALTVSSATGLVVGLGLFFFNFLVFGIWAVTA